MDEGRIEIYKTLTMEGMNEILKLPEGRDGERTRGEEGHRRWIDRYNERGQF